jgi:ribosomal protein L7Ae-like RNA K-turn-binding protein
MPERTISRADAWALLGLARRAGSVQVGVGPAREALRDGTAHLLICAPDGSHGQRRKVEALATAREIPMLSGPNRAELGRLVGAVPVTAVAVTDAALAGRILAVAAEGKTDGPSIPPISGGKR